MWTARAALPTLPPLPPSICHPDPLSIAAYSTCPDNRWHARIAPLLAAPEMVMLNVGANKGFNLMEFVQRYAAAAPSNLTHAAWYSLLMANGCQAQCCGVCKVCKSKRVARQARATSLSLHAFELQPANAQLLRRLVAATGVPVTVHSTAVSNASGTVYASSAVQPGSESFGLARSARGNNVVAQPVTTIDLFMQTHGVQHAHFVSIDTEGEDPLVLRGMAATLASKRVDVVEFEYNRKWKATLRSPRPLGPVVEWLRGLGYTCFWQGNKGALAQLSAPCYVEETRNRFGFARSNAVCSHRQDVVSAMRSCVTPKACSPTW